MLSRSSSNLSASMSCLGRRSHGWAQTAALRALVRATAEFRAPRTATMVISGQGVDRCTPHGAGRRSPPRRLVYGGTEGAAGLMEWLLTSKLRRMWSPTSAKKKRFLAAAAPCPPPRTNSRTTGQATPTRGQGRAQGRRRSPLARSMDAPPRPPPVGQQQHHGRRYGPSTRAFPSPGARTPGLAPKPPRSGRLGVFCTQNRPNMPPRFKWCPNCHGSWIFYANRLKFSFSSTRAFI